MVARAALSLALVACLQWPPPGADPTERPGQERVTQRTWDTIREAFGLELEGVHASVWWMAVSECDNRPGLYGFMVGGLCVGGMTWDCGHVLVADYEQAEQRERALAHELGHCALLWDGLDPDAGHEWLAYWEVVESIPSLAR